MRTPPSPLNALECSRFQFTSSSFPMNQVKGYVEHVSLVASSLSCYVPWLQVSLFISQRYVAYTLFALGRSFRELCCALLVCQGNQVRLSGCNPFHNMVLSRAWINCFFFSFLCSVRIILFISLICRSIQTLPLVTILKYCFTY